MLYALLCYNDEDTVWALDKKQDDEVMAALGVVRGQLEAAGKLGPSLRLLPTTAATTLRKSDPPLIIDGPYAETKEQLLGFYIVDVADLDEALSIARQLGAANPGGAYEIRPLAVYNPGVAFWLERGGGVKDAAWIDAAITAARPQAVGALLRYFRDLDTAEEAFQDACLRALGNWPKNGPPRDPAAWLIMVGRNAALDGVRKRSRQTELPDEAAISDLEDVEERTAERIDSGDYRDDVLRLLFICCHPDLPANQQIALALRIVSGIPLKQIARAFVVGEAAMEQRITRAKARIGAGGAGFETPGPVERAERLAAVAKMLYLVFNEGYSAPDNPDRLQFAGEAIRLTRLLLRLYQTEPEIMGLLALMLLQHARTPARFDAEGQIILLDDQDRALWDRKMIAEGLALIDKAMRHRRPGEYQVQAAIAALHDRAATPADTDWSEIDQLYATLERLTPSPIVTLNRAVAVNKVAGPQAALEMIAPLGERLAAYFHFHGLTGALNLELGRHEAAHAAFDKAISLANTAAEAAHIRHHLDRLAAGHAPK